jgi:hypothetical protein
MRMPMEVRRGARDAVSVIGHERKRGEEEEVAVVALAGEGDAIAIEKLS